jgi:hypothetical protein
MLADCPCVACRPSGNRWVETTPQPVDVRWAMEKHQGPGFGTEAGTTLRARRRHAMFCHAFVSTDVAPALRLVPGGKA